MNAPRGKRNVLGVLVDVVDYDEAVERIIAAALEQRPYAVSAIAVHGVMTGRDLEHRARLNRFELLAPDGQPVRWALNLLYGAGLVDTVRGTNLSLAVLERAAQERLPVFFYGSTPIVLDNLSSALGRRVPDLLVAGMEPSRFRAVSANHLDNLARRITDTDAAMVLVGLGCPRQEIFVYEMRQRLRRPLLAVGAAFEYLSGDLRSPPGWMRANGLEWVWRLMLDPCRLWKRYVLLNPAYLALLALQATRVWRPRTVTLAPSPLGLVEA